VGAAVDASLENAHRARRGRPGGFIGIMRHGSRGSLSGRAAGWPRLFLAGPPERARYRPVPAMFLDTDLARPVGTRVGPIAPRVGTWRGPDTRGGPDTRRAGGVRDRAVASA
jgi:hypothetical protein